MPVLTENLIIVLVTIVAVVMLGVTYLVVKTRRNVPLSLKIKGFGVEFSLSPYNPGNRNEEKD